MVNKLKTHDKKKSVDIYGTFPSSNNKKSSSGHQEGLKYPSVDIYGTFGGPSKPIPSKSPVKSSRVIYEPHPTQPGASIAKTRIDVQKGGETTIRDVKTGRVVERQKLSPGSKASSVSAPQLGVLSYSAQEKIQKKEKKKEIQKKKDKKDLKKLYASEYNKRMKDKKKRALNLFKQSIAPKYKKKVDKKKDDIKLTVYPSRKKSGQETIDVTSSLTDIISTKIPNLGKRKKSSQETIDKTTKLIDILPKKLQTKDPGFTRGKGGRIDKADKISTIAKIKQKLREKTNIRTAKGKSGETIYLTDNAKQAASIKLAGGIAITMGEGYVAGKLINMLNKVPKAARGSVKLGSALNKLDKIKKGSSNKVIKVIDKLPKAITSGMAIVWVGDTIYKVSTAKNGRELSMIAIDNAAFMAGAKISGIKIKDIFTTEMKPSKAKTVLKKETGTTKPSKNKIIKLLEKYKNNKQKKAELMKAYAVENKKYEKKVLDTFNKARNDEIKRIQLEQEQKIKDIKNLVKQEKENVINKRIADKIRKFERKQGKEFRKNKLKDIDKRKAERIKQRFQTDYKKKSDIIIKQNEKDIKQFQADMKILSESIKANKIKRKALERKQKFIDNKKKYDEYKNKINKVDDNIKTDKAQLKAITYIKIKKAKENKLINNIKKRKDKFYRKQLRLEEQKLKDITKNKDKYNKNMIDLYMRSIINKGEPVFDKYKPKKKKSLNSYDIIKKSGKKDGIEDLYELKILESDVGSGKQKLKQLQIDITKKPSKQILDKSITKQVKQEIKLKDKKESVIDKLEREKAERLKKKKIKAIKERDEKLRIEREKIKDKTIDKQSQRDTTKPKIKKRINDRIKEKIKSVTTIYPISKIKSKIGIKSKVDISQKQKQQQKQKQKQKQIQEQALESDIITVYDPGKPRPEKSRPDKPRPDKPRPDKPRPDKPRPDKPRPDKPRPDKPRPDKPRPDKPRPKIPEIIIPDIIKPKKKKKLKEFILQYINSNKYKKKPHKLYYTPTLLGIGKKATITKGQFTGFEIRGNIIKPVKVKRYKKQSGATVRKHRRRKPRTR